MQKEMRQRPKVPAKTMSAGDRAPRSNRVTAMSDNDTSGLRRLPSVKALFFFNVIATHLNLVRAAKELRLTQGALSRQLKALEEHFGVELFRRAPRGLVFTQEGEVLFDYSRRAFETLGAGVQRLSLNTARETLVVSVARSFALSAICRRIGDFASDHPWIDLQIDVHRYFADIDSSGADISIRLGDGDWGAYRMLPLTDDRLCVVCSPGLAETYDQVEATSPLPAGLLLRNTERDYWWRWQESDNRIFDIEATPSLLFNDSAPMIEVAKSGAGLCLTRHVLVADDLRTGALTQLWGQDLHDGLRYYAVCASRSMRRRAVELFMAWLALAFPVGPSETPEVEPPPSPALPAIFAKPPRPEPAPGRA